MTEGVELEVNVNQQFSLLSDPHLLNVIFGNLLDNALRFKKGEGNQHKVALIVYQEKTDLILRVEDNGRGIPEAKHDAVFDMFVKSQQDYDGSGLGLYLVKKAVAKLNGQLTLNSSENSGTVIEVRLPQL